MKILLPIDKVSSFVCPLKGTYLKNKRHLFHISYFIFLAISMYQETGGFQI